MPSDHVTRVQIDARERGLGLLRLHREVSSNATHAQLQTSEEDAPETCANQAGTASTVARVQLLTATSEFGVLCMLRAM